MQTKAVILFDGICSLCTWSVQFIINHDSQHHFKFTPLQSVEGRRLIADHDVPIETIDSIILIEDSRYLIRSSAAIRILQQLPGWWSLITLLTIIPQPIRDWCYDLIARNRYNWFGEINTCALPLNVDQTRFLE